MANILKMFGTNANKERDGVEVMLAEDVYVTIARAGGNNKAFMVAQSRALKPYQRQIATGNINIDVVRDINIKLYAKHIVKGWRGVEIDGKPVPFNEENFIDICKKAPDFFNAVFEEANNIASFQDEYNSAVTGE